LPTRHRASVDALAINCAPIASRGRKINAAR
jgi:hypothetical protein